MPLAFPRPLPGWMTISSSLVRPKFSVAAPRTRSGEVLRVEIADAFWTAEITFNPRFAADVVRLYTWYDSMQGGLGSFLAHDDARCRPLTYINTGLPATKAGGGAFDGSCDVDAVTAYTITLSGLPDAFVFVEGDFVGLVQSGRYSLHRVTADATANGSGVVTVDVVPPVNMNVFDDDATAQVEKPVAEFIPTDIAGTPSVEAVPTTISGVQKL